MGKVLGLWLLGILLCCGAQCDDHSKDHHHHIHDTDHQHEESELQCRKLMPANSDFAFSLYKQLNSLPDGESRNIFYSPLSISTALSVMALGAKGTTHDQLFETLGFSPSGLNETEVNHAFEHLFHMLSHKNNELQLEAGNVVYLQEGFKPNPTFLKDAQHFYDTKGFTVNFQKPDFAKVEINTYIAMKTHGKIVDLIKDLDSKAVMVLVNYMFFRGKWVKPFDPKYTKEDVFHVNENTTVPVEMMIRSGRFDYYYDEENSTFILMLPYKGDASLMLILPDEGKLKEVEEMLSKDSIKRWHDSLFFSSVDVYLPKFSVSASYSLKEILATMGIINAFSDNADFSRITEEIKLKLSKAAHKAVLDVDEKGTEAGAATFIEVMPMSIPPVVKFNRPFILLIVEKTTKSILFMGKIMNPSLK
ncbi:alpha-1-antitrypsin homolog [Acipenser ruthenus]|uniref:alpha-1-antitrypsin homolog n=1 Tax=Acipenser ruthenus TaxID=7906 RepID=UPI00145B0F3D|nr:alpha-1-antitrypsin homolog [Acipenser ruthenus]XP_058874970.1 alpha-1-antitrypsin homolog [Acipenser ruthenus]